MNAHPKDFDRAVPVEPEEQPAEPDAAAPEAAADAPAEAELAPEAAEETAPEASPGRRLRRAAIIALPLALAIGGGYAWVTGGRYVATEDAYVQQDRVTVMPQVSGQIASVRVAENDTVQAGETLFTTDAAAYRNAVEAARARLASARLDVEKMKAAYAEAVSQADTAGEALETAKSQNDRQQALLDRGVVAQAGADQAALTLQQARGALSQAESRVTSARAALAGDPDIPTDQHPEVQQALAALHSAELDLAHTVVTAPTAGVVTQTDRLQVGQYVTPAVPVLGIVATGDSWIEANYKETDLTNMTVGQSAEIELDAYPDVHLTGRVASIGAGTGSEFALLPAQNATGNWVKVVQRIPVRIGIAGDQTLPPLRAGMSTQVSVDTGKPRGLPDFVADALDAVGIGTATAAPAEPR